MESTNTRGGPLRRLFFLCKITLFKTYFVIIWLIYHTKNKKGDDIIKKILQILSFLFVLAVFGIGYKIIDKQIYENETKTYDVEFNAIKTSQTFAVEEPEENENQEIIEYIQPDSLNLSYSFLSSEEKEIYSEIYNILLNRESKILTSTIDVNLIEKISQCIINDCPELYYIDGYTYTLHKNKDIITKIEYSGKYTKTKEECIQIDEKINEYIAKLEIPKESNYEKVKYLYDYIILNTEYDLNAVDNQNICSVFLNNKSVCLGYAKSLQYLLKQNNIPCTIVHGQSNGESHAWNLVYIDNAYYYIDPTWGDSTYVHLSDVRPIIDYNFFCITSKDLAKTHIIDNVIETPICVNTENNYYIKEGLYIDDIRKLDQILTNIENKEYIELKCSNINIYNEVYEYLITNQYIFNYINETTENILFMENELFLTLTIWT